jgi:acid ceramidase
MKNYTIHLDKQTQDSCIWAEIIDDNIDNIKKIFNLMSEMHDNIIGSIASNIISFSSKMDYVKYADEIEYISKKTDIPFGKLVLLQIMYELSACCTSMIYLNNETPVHLRTMDWPLDFLKKLTITVDFQRNGKTVYKTITWAGYIGAFTAMKPGVCSISMNYRETDTSILNNILNLAKSYWPSGYLIRHVMETENDISKIYDYLTEAKLVAPCYFVLCGNTKKECFDIVRDRVSSKDIYKLDGQYLIQTNIDPDSKLRENEKKDILYSVRRQTCGAKLIKDLCKTKLENKEILSTVKDFPIINDETVYKCIMIPSKEYFECSLVE